MAQSPRKIVFNVPSLIPERPGPRPAERVVARAVPTVAAHDGDRKKLATLMEVGQALAGTFNLQAGLYGVLEVLERRCGAMRGTVALLEPDTGSWPSRLHSGIRRPRDGFATASARASRAGPSSPGHPSWSPRRSAKPARRSPSSGCPFCWTPLLSAP